MIHLTSTNPTMQHINDYVAMGNDIIVRRYNILSSTTVCYDVYQQVASNTMSDTFDHFSTAMHDDIFGWLGDITTRRLPAEIDAIPAGNERSRAVRAYHAELDAQAEAYIRAAFPQDVFFE